MRSQNRRKKVATPDKEVKAVYLCMVEGCKVCFPRWGNLNLHYKAVHPGIETPSTEKCKVDDVPEGYTLKLGQKPPVNPSGDSKGAAIAEPATSPGADEKETVTEQKNVYKEVEEPSAILRRILETYPNLEKAVAAEIMDYANLKGTLHPMEVKQLLSAMAGVPKGGAEIIPQKYSLALQKAAEDGKQEVQLALYSWNIGMPYTPRTSGGFNFMPFGGMFSGQGAGAARFNPAFGGGFMGQGYQPWWMNAGGQTMDTKTESPADAAREKEITELREGQNQLNKSLEAILNRITETEEQKKEAALNARLDGIETAIAQLVAGPRDEEAKDKVYEAIMRELSDTKAEIGKMREEAAQNRIKSLEEQIASLSVKIKDQDDERIKRLEAELEETKAAAKAPVTGRTEMDVVDNLANKALDSLNEAGRNVQAWLMSGQTREKYNPHRGSTEQRKEAGEKLAAAVESEVALSAAEQAYLND